MINLRFVSKYVLVLVFLVSITVFIGCDFGFGGSGKSNVLGNSENSIDEPIGSVEEPDNGEGKVEEPAEEPGTFEGLSAEMEAQIKQVYLKKFLDLDYDFKYQPAPGESTKLVTIDNVKFEKYYGTYNDCFVVLLYLYGYDLTLDMLPRGFLYDSLDHSHFQPSR